MIELENFKGKLSETGQRALSLAIEESQKRGQNYLGTEHLFLALAEVEKSLLFEVMTELRVDPTIIIHALNQHLSISNVYSGEEMKILPNTKNIFKQALDDVHRSGRKVIETTDLLMAIFQDTHAMSAKILRSLGVEPSILVEKITHRVRTREEKGEEFKKKYELPPIIGREAEISWYQ